MQSLIQFHAFYLLVSNHSVLDVCCFFILQFNYCGCLFYVLMLQCSQVGYRKGKEELHHYNMVPDRPDIVNATNAAKLASDVSLFVCVCV